MDMVECGEMTAEDANMEKVLTQRVLVVKKLPKEARSALDKAVKSGNLRHKRKEGLKPEVYYHPSFEYLANFERNRAEQNTLAALAKVTALPLEGGKS